MRHTIFCRILAVALVLTLAGWVGAPTRLMASPVPAGGLAGVPGFQESQGAGLLAQLRSWLSAMWPAGGAGTGAAATARRPVRPHATCTFDPNGSQQCTADVMPPSITCTMDPNGVQHCLNS